MHPSEIESMSALESTHWWYCGLRDLLQRTLLMPRWRPSPGASVLDAGCGTGENLRLIERLLAPAYLGGFDLSPQAVSLSRTKAGRADLYLSDLRDPEIRAPRLDLILSCDALSIAGLADCRAGLVRMIERLRSGGLLVLHLPAYAWLFSSHDRAIETRDRVSTGQVGELLRTLGLTVELLTYRLFFLFPAVVCARLPSLLGGQRGSARSDLKQEPFWLNAALFATLRAENRAIVQGTTFSWGSSVYAVGRRP
jgi:SAM-dependent methyltransferase